LIFFEFFEKNTQAAVFCVDKRQNFGENNNISKSAERKSMSPTPLFIDEVYRPANVISGNINLPYFLNASFILSGVSVKTSTKPTVRSCLQLKKRAVEKKNYGKIAKRGVI